MLPRGWPWIQFVFGAFTCAYSEKRSRSTTYLLVPALLAGFAQRHVPRDLSRNIRLNLPLVSAAMDTVTEARLAIAIAQEGIDIVHKNLAPQERAAQVAKVKL